MLSLKQAAQAVFVPAPRTLQGCPNESDRILALSRALIALRSISVLGLSCGVFGSALRSGDFFHHSDVDMVAWLPHLEPISGALALNARIECHRSMAGIPFDLVLLPCANEAFGHKIMTHWVRGSAEVERATLGQPLLVPLNFGAHDVAFIVKARLVIAARASARMTVAAQNVESGTAERLILSLCASMQTVVRAAEKCAKDMLRHFTPISPPSSALRPLYPILIYPCDDLGGLCLASEVSLFLYTQCCHLLDTPNRIIFSTPALLFAWAKRMALTATLFTHAMSSDFEPALALMAMKSTEIESKILT